MSRIFLLSLLFGFIVPTSMLSTPSIVQAADEGIPGGVPVLEEYLASGNLDAGIAAFKTRLEQDPADDQSRFGLSTMQILTSVQRLSQSLHRFGLLADSPKLPFVRLPVLPNDEPDPITYEDFRGMLQQFVEDLAEAEATLARMEDKDVKLNIRVGNVRLDLDGDGMASESETFWKVFTSVALRAAKVELTDEQKAFPIAFDRADVHWMRGYTHLLRAIAQAYLAYDSEEFFNHTAHVFFAGAKSPYGELARSRAEGMEVGWIADLAAAIHLFDFKVDDPQRMKQAHAHLLAMIEQSRLCWKFAQQEQDDNREWIPNANQTSLLPGLEVTQQRVDGWREFLDELEAILKGEKLVPHWRLKQDHGINLKRVFYEPRSFDLVMWVHGAAAIGFMQKGERTDAETWRRIRRIFGGNFLVFAVWFQ